MRDLQGGLQLKLAYVILLMIALPVSFGQTKEQMRFSYHVWGTVTDCPVPAVRSANVGRSSGSQKILSMKLRAREANSSDVAEITLMSPGDILFLYTDGVYDGSDDEERQRLESVLREHCKQSARDICNAVLDHAKRNDDNLRQIGEADLIDDKTVFIIKRS